MEGLEDISLPGEGGIPTATTAEELDKILGEQGSEEEFDIDENGNAKDRVPKPGTKKPAAKPAGEEEEEEEEGDLPKLGKGKKPVSQPAKKDGEEEGDEVDENADEDNYDNVIHYLDKKHGLGLNLTELPENLTREDEAELVSDLFQRVVKNADTKLRQYQEIEQLLEDDEVAALIQAKSEGKGLKDLFVTFSQSAEGMTDEQLVFNDFKQRYPKFSETQINNMIAAQKKEGQFVDLAKAIREQRIEESTLSEKQREQREKQEALRAQQEYQQEVHQFSGFVNKVQKINDVSFTEDMKAEVLDFILKRDDEGKTQLDNALQSDVGVLRAAIGVILLDKLMSANASVMRNKGKKDLFGKLLTKPVEGGGSQRRNGQDIPDDVFNLF
jgi:hypothetical protein